MLWGMGLTAALGAFYGAKKEDILRHPFDVYMGKDDAGRPLHQNLFFVGAPGDFLTLASDVARFGALLGPGHFVAGKLGAIPKAAMHLMTNQDATGKRVYPPGATMAEKSLDSAISAFKDTVPFPFSVGSVGKMALDKDRSFSPGEYVATALAGRQPHAAGSPAEEILVGYLQDSESGRGPASDRNLIKNDIARAMRVGNTNKAMSLITSGLEGGKITDADVDHAMNRANMPMIAADFEAAPLEIELRAMAVADPEEQILFRPLLGKKIESAMRTMAPLEQRKLLQDMESAGLFK